jgi:hypothetical protein
MTGARFTVGATTMEKVARETFAVPSDTAIVMAEKVPADVGMPLSRPLVVLKVAQAGLLVMLNVSACPSGSDAVGVKLYVWPTLAVAGGVPLMTGARFTAGTTAMVKAASDVIATPSNAEIVIAGWVPVDVGVPLNLPVA